MSALPHYSNSQEVPRLQLQHSLQAASQRLFLPYRLDDADCALHAWTELMPCQTMPSAQREVRASPFAASSPSVKASIPSLISGGPLAVWSTPPLIFQKITKTQRDATGTRDPA